MRCQENNIKIMPCRYQTRRKNPDRSDVEKLLSNKCNDYWKCIAIHLCLLQDEVADNYIKGRQLSGKVDGEGYLDKPKTTIPGETYVVWRWCWTTKRQESTCHQSSSRVEFFHGDAFRKGRLKRILQLLKKRKSPHAPVIHKSNN